MSYQSEAQKGKDRGHSQSIRGRQFETKWKQVGP